MGGIKLNEGSHAFHPVSVVRNLDHFEVGQSGIWTRPWQLEVRQIVWTMNIHVNCSWIGSLSEACWVQQPSLEKDGVQKWPLNSWNVSQNKPLNPNLPTSVTLHWVKETKKHCQRHNGPDQRVEIFHQSNCFWVTSKSLPNSRLKIVIQLGFKISILNQNLKIQL